VQHVGDKLGVVGGGLTALFNICTADWNVKDSPPSDNLMLFTSFASNNKGNLIPPSVWDSLDDSTKDQMKSIFDMNKGNFDFPLAHLSCHWGAPPPDPPKLAAGIRALKQLDTDLANVNTHAVELLQKVSTQ
jgi:hypothetical protein